MAEAVVGQALLEPPKSFRDTVRSNAGRVRNFLRARWKYLLFAAAMFTIAALTLHLFYKAISISQKTVVVYVDSSKAVPPSIPEKVPEGWWRLEVTLVMFIVVFVPFMLFCAELVRHARERERTKNESLLELSIHAVPYGILALSMLFEYKKIQHGESEGLIALASIMIIFILAELGLFMYTNIRGAKRVSEILEDRIDRVRTTLDGLPWLNHFHQLTDAAAGKGTIVNEIGSLLSEWASLIRERRDHSHIKSMLNIFLQNYIREEILDVTAGTNDDSVPAIVVPPIPEKRGKVSYFATNLAFYAAFVKSAVNHLAEAD